MDMLDGFKRLGEERLTWFSEAKKSIHHARAVVDLNYSKSTEAVRKLLAEDLHYAALTAERLGYKNPWFNAVGTLFVLTYEGSRPVYIPAAFTNPSQVNDLSARGIYAKLAHQAISQANTLIAGVP